MASFEATTRDPHAGRGSELATERGSELGEIQIIVRCSTWIL